jgi:putative restriction endonuclease
VAREYGAEYPERPLMSIISDLLGIEHFTTSRGSTVRSDFLNTVAAALGTDTEQLRQLRKDEILRTCVESATRQRMDPTLLSPGATVTNRALQAIIDGLIENGVPGRPPVERLQPTPVAEERADELFDPAAVRDERDRRLMQIAARQGQDRFRLALLEAYDYRCAISEFDAVETLEAAHIYPYRGPATNHVTNGLLLRADVHILYDRGAISVHETTHEVLLKPHLDVTRYRELSGRHLRLPRKVDDRPSVAALRSHREWAGL